MAKVKTGSAKQKARRSTRTLAKKKDTRKTRTRKSTAKKTILQKPKTVKVKPAQTRKSSSVSVSKTRKKTKDSTRSARKKTLSAKEKRELRARLTSLRERIVGQVDSLATNNLNRTQSNAEIDFGSEEYSTDNYDRDFALTRVGLEQDIIFEIDKALNKLKVGAYGICEGCGNRIEKARLSAQPYSQLCVTCKSDIESGKKCYRPDETQSVFPNVEKASRSHEENEE